MKLSRITTPVATTIGGTIAVVGATSASAEALAVGVACFGLPAVIGPALDKRPQRRNGKCYCGHRWKACVVHQNPSEAFPEPTAEASALDTLKAAYVAGSITADLLENYTDRVVKGGHSIKRIVSDEIRDNGYEVVELLGSLREYAPPHENVQHICPCKGCALKRDEDDAKIARAKRSDYCRCSPSGGPGCSICAQRSKPVQVIERPAPPAFVYEKPLSGSRLVLNADDIMCVTDNGGRGGVDVTMRDGRTFHNLIPRGRQARVTREFVPESEQMPAMRSDGPIGGYVEASMRSLEASYTDTLRAFHEIHRGYKLAKGDNHACGCAKKLQGRRGHTHDCLGVEDAR